MKSVKRKYLQRYLIKIRNSQRWIRKYCNRFSFPEYTSFTLFSILIGIAVGLAAVFFHNSIEFFNKIFFEKTKDGLYFLGAASVIFLPAIGMLIQSFMIRSSPNIAKQKGVSEIIKSVATRNTFISFRTTLFHFIAPVVCIGSGGTLGPEGPAAQLGGGISSKISQIFNFTDERRKIYTAAGAGAAIAAIFNTPLGGVFFALEIVLLNDFRTASFSSLIIASVTASTISRIFLGNESIFVFSINAFEQYSHLIYYLLLGLVSGFLSLFFIRYSAIVKRLFLKKIYASKIPQWLAMSFVGILVGIAGFYFKEIYGIGYSSINEILAVSLTWEIVLVLLGLKFLLVPLILYSGGYGGVFAPSLFMGACLGYLFTISLNIFFGVTVDTTTMILVGMGAVLGGINTIPISAIMIIFEMTQEYSFILPLMLAVIFSTTVVQLFLRNSVHVKNLEADGFKLTDISEKNILTDILVSDIELHPIELIPDETSLPVLTSRFIENPNSSFYTTNAEGKISGIISENELRPIITEYESLKDVIVAKDIINPDVFFVEGTDSLDYVLKLFSKYNYDQFPVISSGDSSIILGSVTRQQVLEIYNRESLKNNLAEGLAREFRSLERYSSIKISEGFSIIELPVPSKFIGKSLSDLRLRNKFGLEILMIKQNTEFLVDNSKSEIKQPDANYILNQNDILIIFGRDEKIQLFREM